MKLGYESDMLQPSRSGEIPKVIVISYKDTLSEVNWYNEVFFAGFFIVGVD